LFTCAGEAKLHHAKRVLKMKQLRWEFAISFVSIAVIIGFAMYISVSAASSSIALVGWFILVFSVLGLIGVLFNELEPSMQQVPMKQSMPSRRPARRRRR